MFIPSPCMNDENERKCMEMNVNVNSRPYEGFDTLLFTVGHREVKNFCKTHFGSVPRIWDIKCSVIKGE